MKKMTDKDVEILIERIEREGMLDPPVGFQKEVLWQIRQKRKRKKDMQLFSYGAKVFVTMAATLFILFSVPATFDSKEWMPEHTNMFLNRISVTLDQYCSKVNDSLDQLVNWRK